MYTHTGELAAVAGAVAAAAPLIAADRARFAPARAAVLAYAAGVFARGAAGAPLYLTGPAGTAALKGAPVDADVYDFVSTDSGAHAVALARAVLPHAGGAIVAADYDARARQFYVEVGGRRVAGLVALPRPPGATARALFAPVVAAVAGTPGVPCVPPEVRLYEVYRALGDPGRAAEWGELLADEEQLFALAAADLHKRVARLTSGGAAGAGADPLPAALRRALADVAAADGRAVVDATGVPLQAVSALGSAADARAAVAAGGRAGAKLDVRAIAVALPVDAALTRLKVYWRGAPVMDIFDAAERELVPLAPLADSPGGAEDVVGGRRRKGARAKARKAAAAPPKRRAPGWGTAGRRVTEFGALRFHVADLWTALVLFQRGVVSGDRARALVYAAFDRVAAARVRASATPLAAALPVSADAYLGAVTDPAVLQRRALAAGRRLTPKGFPVVLRA